MNPQDTYDQLWKENFPLIQSNQIQVDPQLDDLAHDSRVGVTLLCRPDNHTASQIQHFLEESAHIEPDQHHYSKESFHTTVLSIITTGTDFNPEALNLQHYVSLIKEAIQEVPYFSIEYKGVTTSSGAVMIQGFPTNQTLESIRKNLRVVFKKSALLSTIDTRYVLHTAHITCIRFKSPLENSKQYATFLNQNRETFFEKSRITELELVLNDWFMTPQKTTILDTFPLKKG